MRIIAGSAGGIRLVMPGGSGDVRPTPDLAKGAIFSSLGELVLEAQVLDLYAGSGGLGLEALSRGAASATFVDQSRQCVEAIEKNLELARLQDRAEVLCADLSRGLRRLDVASQFTLVLADPPYTKKPGQRSLGQQLLDDPDLASLVEPGGWFILEHYKNEELIPPSTWEFNRLQKHGDTAASFFVRTAAQVE